MYDNENECNWFYDESCDVVFLKATDQNGEEYYINFCQGVDRPDLIEKATAEIFPGMLFDRSED